MTHIAVIGAGITGVTTAFQLREQGHDVTLIDRHRYPAMETSYANGGQLSACNAEVWNQRATLLKGLKWMFTPGAPFLLNPRPSWHKLSWLAEFVMAIPRYRMNTVQTARLAVAARAPLLAMAERAGLAFDLRRQGIMHVVSTEAEMASARRVSLLLAEAGVDRRELEAGEVRAHAPGIDGPIAGGFFTDSDMSGDIHLFTVGLAQWLEGTGTVLRLGTRVDGLRPGAEDVRLMLDGEEARFDGVVIAAGVASRALARAAGDRVNVYPVKGYSVTVALEDAASKAAAPEVSLVDDSAKIVTSRLGENRLRIAGTAELNGFNRDIRADRIAPLLDWCGRRFPAVRTERAEPWAGLRPMMPDMMPRVGGGRHPRVFYNTGHGHLGWTLAGATAVAVAGAVTEGLRAQTGRTHPVRAMAQPG